MALKILVVYEDKSIAELLVEALTSMGMEVQQAGKGSEAAALASQQQFDGLFVDPAMPLANACELAARVRQSSLNRHTSLFVLTVRPDDYAVAQAFESAGTFFLRDPIELDSLTRLIKERRGDTLDLRRRKPRNPLTTEVVRRALSIEFKGMSRDLSEDGILFQDNGTLEMGQKVGLTFTLPDGKPPMNVEGVVLRIDAQHRALVCFTSISRPDRQRIKNFLAVKAV